MYSRTGPHVQMSNLREERMWVNILSLPIFAASRSGVSVSFGSRPLPAMYALSVVRHGTFVSVSYA